MTTAFQQQHHRRGTGDRRPLSWGLVCLALATAALLALPGCGGCRSDPETAAEEREKKEAEERAKKKKPKPDFVDIEGKSPPRLTTRPNTRKWDDLRDAVGPPYKPGHWTATTLYAKTNNFDFLGDLEIAATDRDGEPIPLQGTPFDLTTTRQVSLPKRQPKILESVLFVPASQRQALLSCRLNYSKGGRMAWQDRRRLAQMPSYQYHFVVLARLPERYTYLKLLASVKPPADEFMTGLSAPYYRVALLRADKANRQPLLPSHGLLWTSIACVLWDDAVPEALSPKQQQALLDWLHWGGQLILSGPDSLDSLRDGFLAPYLPATAAGTRELDQSDFQELQNWSGKPIRDLLPAGTLAGVKLKVDDPRAQSMPGSGGLLVERRVGRGRIVVSAFRLGSRQLIDWPGFDEVFNAFLLRRKPREFTYSDDEGDQIVWADDDPNRHRFDAGRICNLRYFTRDTGVQMKDYSPETGHKPDDGSWDNVGPYGNPPAADQWDVGIDFPSGPGVAAWNDTGPVAGAARSALKDAAQIKIPNRRFVLWILAGYLLVLVPVNWALFRLLGRVEWAWIAAPVIAVACTVVVIRMAELDIGFASSRTEISVIEIQPGYSRAHVTRYTALYTSLTTYYDFQLDEPGALSQPFARFSDPSDRRGLLYRRGTEAVLEDYFVRSHSTGAVHCEQMVDLGGTLSLRKIPDGRFELTNGTELALHHAGVLSKDEQGIVHSAWVGTLEPEDKVLLNLLSGTDMALWSQHRSESVLAGDLPEGELSIGGLANLAQDTESLQPGQMRLIAVLQQQIPGPTIDPDAHISQAAGLVVAHLRHGFGEDPLPDKNRPSEEESTAADSEESEVQQPDPQLTTPPPLTLE